MGFRTVAISSSAAKKDIALTLGADIFLDSSSQNVIEELQKLGGADVIVSTAPNAEAVMKMLNKQAKIAGLVGFEMIKRIHLSNELLTVENGCLTPTLKIKRSVLSNEFSVLWKGDADRSEFTGRMSITGSRTS